MSNTILLSIEMMVSNRVTTTYRALDSLQPILAAIPCEVILVDTGCEENLRKGIEKYANKIVEFEWCDDFAKARNAGLSQAEGEWFLYLDDDEYFTEAKELIEFFQSGRYHDYAGAEYVQRNYLDEAGSQYTDTWVARMARRTPELTFKSRIHEYLYPIEGKVAHLRSIVDHYGYVYATEEAKHTHFLRNKTLLEKMIEEEPTKIRWHLQLLQEYRAIDEYDDMLELSEDVLAHEERYDSIPDIYLGTFYAGRVLAYLGEESYEKAMEACLEMEKDSRNTKLCQGFLTFSRARANYFLGDYLDSENCSREYLELLAYFEANTEELYEQMVAPFVGECFDVVKKKEIYSILICCGLKRRSTEYLMQYMDQLYWDEQHVYVFELMMDTVIEAMIQMDRDEAFLSLIALMKQNEALWNYFAEMVIEAEKQGKDVTSISQYLDELARDESSNEMEAQIISQLELLISNGLLDQARQMIPRLQQMLPHSKRLVEIERDIM